MYPPIPGVRVIGLGYKARHGKDTMAKLLTMLSRGEAQRYAFADALKAVARVEHGMTEKDGPLLQALGTEVYREGRTAVVNGRTVSARTHDPEIWVKTLYYRIAEERPAIAVITDARFPNEGAMVKAMGGTTVHVQRVLANGTLFRDPARNPLHASEVAMDDYGWDETIVNPDGQPEAFARHVAVWFDRWAACQRAA